MDVVILSREGLDELVAEGRIIAESDVDLAVTLIGLAVRAGAPRPNISDIASFRHTLVSAKAVAIPTSTGGRHVTDSVVPRLGISGQVVVRLTERGAAAVALVAGGEAELAIQPVSELIHAKGVDFVSAIPAELQFESVYSAAIIRGAADVTQSRRLVAFLASSQATPAVENNGMRRARPRRPVAGR